MTNKKKLKLENTCERVIPLTLNEDKDGRFFVYCDFFRHLGLVKDPRECLERNCEHYIIFREEILYR